MATHIQLAVKQIAEACLNGEDCEFALHDALLDAGMPETAAHYRRDDHTKGKKCAVTEMLVTGKPGLLNVYSRSEAAMIYELGLRKPLE